MRVVRSQRRRFWGQHDEETRHDDESVDDQPPNERWSIRYQFHERIQCPPPRGYERLPRRHPGHGPRFPRGYVAERPAQRSLVGQSLDMTTPTASLVTMEEATDRVAVSTFVENVLSVTGWELQAVRRRSSRFEPPD